MLLAVEMCASASVLGVRSPVSIRFPENVVVQQQQPHQEVPRRTDWKEREKIARVFRESVTNLGYPQNILVTVESSLLLDPCARTKCAGRSRKQVSVFLFLNLLHEHSKDPVIDLSTNSDVRFVKIPRFSIIRYIDFQN